jgi:sugar phosphate permease
VFYLSGVLGFVWLAFFLGVYRRGADDAGPALGPRALLRGWLDLLRYRTTWGMMLGNAGYLYIYYVFATWLPGYLVLARHLSILSSGFVSFLPYAVGFVVTIFGGWLCDKLIARGARRTTVRKSISIIGLVGATIFTLCAAYAGGTIAAVSFITLAVGSFSFSTAALQAIPVDVAPKAVVSSLAALHNFGGNVGGSFAPIVTGVLVTSTGNFVVPLVVTAGVALLLGCLPIAFLIGNIDREYAPAP